MGIGASATHCTSIDIPRQGAGITHVPPPVVPEVQKFHTSNERFLPETFDRAFGLTRHRRTLLQIPLLFVQDPLSPNLRCLPASTAKERCGAQLEQGSSFLGGPFEHNRALCSFRRTANANPGELSNVEKLRDRGIRSKLSYGNWGKRNALYIDPHPKAGRRHHTSAPASSS